MFHLLRNSLTRQPNEEDPDEGIKDLVEITLKRMVRYFILKQHLFQTQTIFCKIADSDYSSYYGH